MLCCFLDSTLVLQIDILFPLFLRRYGREIREIKDVYKKTGSTVPK